MNLGYSPKKLAGYYFRFILGVNAIVLLLSAAAIVAATSVWQAKLTDLGINAATVWPTVAVMAVILGLLTAFSGCVTWRVIRKIWRE